MKKVFWVFVVFLISVSVMAQQDETELSNDTSAQASSNAIVSADSAVDKRLDSASYIEQIDSAEQNGVNEINVADGAVTLKISTDPSEAGLKIGDRDYGLTPAVITDLDVGEHVLELSKSGHFRRRVTIQLDSAGADLHFELLRPASIFVTSEPARAQVSFDGKPSGITPFQSERMRPGGYPLSLSFDGYELYETTVNLKSGLSDTLRVTLKPLKPEIVQPETQTAQAQPEDPKKAWLNKERKRAGFVTVVFFVFIAILIGVEKTSY
jgi:hypothetical protein